MATFEQHAKQLQDYAAGVENTECPHPLNRIAECGHKDICTLCGTVVFVQAFREVKLVKATRATPADVSRMWARIWGDASQNQVQAITASEFDNDEAAKLWKRFHATQPAEHFNSDAEFEAARMATNKDQ